MKAGRILKLLALSLACAAVPAGAASGQTAKPSKEQAETALLRFKVLYSAMLSPKVAAPIKQALFACIYQHSMGEISARMDQVLAANPKAKVDPSSPDQQLGLMAAICGYKSPKASPK